MTELRGDLGGLQVSIDEQVVTDRLDRWDVHTGALRQDSIDQICALCQAHEQARVEGLLREIEIIILSELNQNLNLYPWWRVLKEREVGK